MECWNVGILGKKDANISNDLIPFCHPVFHSSSIPSFRSVRINNFQSSDSKAKSCKNPQ
jgi:hypothetical protein